MGGNTASFGRPGPLVRRALCAWLCAAFACLIAVPAAAQETAAVKAIIVEPLSLVKQADLDFGKVSEAAAGTVVLTPSEIPTCTVTGGVIHFSVCRPATFEGYGESGRTVRLKLPPSGTITLAGPAGATMQVTAMTLDGSPALQPVGNGNGNGFRRFTVVSADGLFNFRVGGTLNVAAGQALGVYTGTFDVDIAYE